MEEEAADGGGSSSPSTGTSASAARQMRRKGTLGETGEPALPEKIGATASSGARYFKKRKTAESTLNADQTVLAARQLCGEIPVSRTTCAQSTYQ